MKMHMVKFVVMIIFWALMFCGITVWGNNRQKKFVVTINQLQEENKKLVELLNYQKEKINHDVMVDKKWITRKSLMKRWVDKNNNWSNPLHDSEIDAIVEIACRHFDGPLILAIAEIESAFDKSAVSKLDCIGLMQINPIHCEEFKITREDLFSPPINIWVAIQLLKKWGVDPLSPDYKFLAKKYFGKASPRYINKIKEAHNDILLYCEVK